MLYYSSKNDREIDMNTMHPEHLHNAMTKIERGESSLYSVNGPVYRTGVVILNKKYRSALLNAGTVIAAEQAKNSFAVKANRSLALAVQELRKLQKEQAEVIDMLSRKDTTPKRHRESELEWLRCLAVSLIRLEGEVSADRLREKVEELSVNIPGKRYTSVFRDPRFKQKLYKQSDWIGARSRYIKTWVLA